MVEAFVQVSQTEGGSCSLSHTTILNCEHFSQLFGESNADEEVSPDTADPEAGAEAGEKALAAESNEEVNLVETASRQLNNFLIFSHIQRETLNVPAHEHGPRQTITIRRKSLTNSSTTTSNTC